MRGPDAENPLDTGPKGSVRTSPGEVDATITIDDRDGYETEPIPVAFDRHRLSSRVRWSTPDDRRLGVPEAVGAELGLIGACIQSDSVRAWAVQSVGSTEMYRPAHRRAFDALTNSTERPVLADDGTVHLPGAGGDVDDVLTASYWHSPSPTLGKRWGNQVRTAFVTRQVMRVLAGGFNAVNDGQDVEDVIAGVRAQLAEWGS